MNFSVAAIATPLQMSCHFVKQVICSSFFAPFFCRINDVIIKIRTYDDIFSTKNKDRKTVRKYTDKQLTWYLYLLFSVQLKPGFGIWLPILILLVIVTFGIGPNIKTNFNISVSVFGLKPKKLVLVAGLVNSLWNMNFDIP